MARDRSGAAVDPPTSAAVASQAPEAPWPRNAIGLSSSASLLQLQRTHGNRHVQGLFHQGPEREPLLAQVGRSTVANRPPRGLVQRCGGEQHAGCACAGGGAPPAVEETALMPAAPIGEEHEGPRLQRLTAEEKQQDLASPKFAGNPRLEKAFDNSPPLGIGESGEAVRLVQEGLVADGIALPGSTKPTGELDGGFGQDTINGVRQFQTKHGLDVDGRVGRQTMGKLDELAANTGEPPLLQPKPGVEPGVIELPGGLQILLPGGASPGEVPEIPGGGALPNVFGQAPERKVDHYVWEIKAWIPLAQVPDPEEALQEARFRLAHLGDEVSDYHSQYRGDAHAGYAGSARVIHRIEFDWDGTRISNFAATPLQHFGTTHREFSALVKPVGGVQPRAIRDQESRTTDRAVSQSHPNPREVRMGMASPNPLTLFPSPDIDADYTLFISRDFGEDTITVRWSTDLMPNHGFRVEKNGTDLKERVVNALPGPLLAPEIFLRLNSKTNGGADSITTLPG
jgi:hypothetical protein